MLNNYIVRIPNDIEIDQMVIMGEQFWVLTTYANKIPYIIEDVRASCEVMKEHGLLLAAFDDNKIAGFIGGLKCPSYTNYSINIGQELFWWVEPEYRDTGVGNLLLSSIEQQAKSIGLTYWTMMYLVNIEPEKTKYLYERNNYKQTEIGYTKEL